MQYFRTKFRRVHILKYKSRMIKRQGRVPTGKKTTIGVFCHSNSPLEHHAELFFFHHPLQCWKFFTCCFPDTGHLFWRCAFIPIKQMGTWLYYFSFEWVKSSRGSDFCMTGLLLMAIPIIFFISHKFYSAVIVLLPNHW